MAHPIKFFEQNIVYTKPPTMTDEECCSLPAYTNGEQIISCWELTPEELKEINETGKVWLSVFGQITPPVCVMGNIPFYRVSNQEAGVVVREGDLE